jgi:catechol 2,3-dioxygenase-like lactoylglutathione lyase family enzyme
LAKLADHRCRDEEDQMTVRRVVVDHVVLVVRDLETSRRFYRAALAPLGIQELNAESGGVAFGAEGMDDFAVVAGRHPTTRAHVAFDAPSREAVDAFYAAALAHGGRHRGAPGVWVQYSERYYAAFVWDPDGNNIEGVFHSPEALAAVAPVRQPQDASQDPKKAEPGTAEDR